MSCLTFKLNAPFTYQRFRHMESQEEPIVETISDQLFYTTVFIETWSQEGQGTGTGFLVNYEVADGGITVLVTNKHVLEGAHTARFRTVAADSNGKASPRATRITVNNFDEQEAWTVHSNSEVDVAAMVFSEIQLKMMEIGAPAFTRSFGPDMFLTSEQAKNLDSIEDVLFVGYPNGLYDTASWLPIARRGQTATPIRNDYQGMPAFLIDASVFPGSSGSPVVLYDRGGMHSDRQGNINMGQRRFHLIGVVAAVHTREVQGEIVLTHKTPSTPVASFQDMIDLGIVFKASAIQECVDGLMEKLNLSIERAPNRENLA